MTTTLDDKYMYEFCTKWCTKKNCPKDVTCLDAHSKAMSRRVPRLMHNGSFNYIPEHCPWYKKKNKCRFGDSCFRSHGFLEVIFHPLLYKTKLCESTHKNGVCRKYGIYCAKAHKYTEIRNLVKIYGEGWKHHYDTNGREAPQWYTGSFAAKDSIMKSRHFDTITKTALSPEAKSEDFMELGFDSMSDYFGESSNTLCSIESLTLGEFPGSPAGQNWGQAPSESIFNLDSGDDEQVHDYTDLYCKKLAELEIRDDISSTSEKRSSLLDVFSWSPENTKNPIALSKETTNSTNDAAIIQDVCNDKGIFLDSQSWGDY